MTRIYADVLRCKRHVYRYIPRRFSGTIIEGKIEGIEAQMVREWKKNLILIEVWLQMVGKEFVHSALSMKQRFLTTIFLLFILSRFSNENVCSILV